MRFKIRIVKYKNQIYARRKISKFLFIGIDHNYLKTKLFKIQMIKSNNKPRHIPKYCSFKPLQILKKFSQKIKILLQYYYGIISIPSSLSYYYYAHKFSCLKTLAYQMKKSVRYTYIFYSHKLKATTNLFSYQFIKKKIESLSLETPNYNVVVTIDSIINQENLNKFIRH
jgi:Type II intron maturase